MTMQIFLVGGAVRDRLLGWPVTEKDWVVTGACPRDLLRLNYRQVGREFPVFLHPGTGEEYALARQERKTGPGYAGFAFDASPDVTLEQDLSRRDLTINAMAETADGRLIDPFGGLKDLKDRWLRHVSPAFVEDPVRILRVARFAARFAGEGFRVAPDTLRLMQSMVASGEVDALIPERVWKETSRALSEPAPHVFFDVLDMCGALSRLFPPGLAVARLGQAAEAVQNTEIRFAILVHRLAPAAVRQVCEKYRLPRSFRELALLVTAHLPAWRGVRAADAAAIVHLLENVDAFRRPARFASWLTACGCSAEAGPVAEVSQYLQQCFVAAGSVCAADLIQAGAGGKEMAERLHAARVAAVAASLHPR